MNLLVVSQYYYPEPFRINEICEELVKRGHRVTVLTANPNYPDGEVYAGYENKDCREVINGVTVYRCKCRPRYKGSVNLARNYVDFVVRANKRIMKLNAEFDYIFVYQLSPVTSCLPAIKYKRKYHIPMVLYCLDVWPESLKGTLMGSSFYLKMFGQLSRYIYKSADKIAVSSPSFATYLSALCDIDKACLEYIPQHSNEVKTYGGSSALRKNPKKINFLFTGNIGESQNLECLLKAVTLIQNREKIVFHVVGSGSHYERCLKLSMNLGVDDVFVFYGRFPKEDVSKFYDIADICYVSLKDEGVVGNTIPGKIQEYMSAGKPILASIKGDAADLIRSAKCGLCVSPGDVEELAKAIVKFSDSGTDLEEMGKNSRKFYETHFTIEKYVNHLLEFFSENNENLVNKIKKESL